MEIAHIFAHEATNAGDIYLKEATQLAFMTIFPNAKFNKLEIRKIYSKKDIDYLNKHDLIILGGGGLFLKDTFPNKVSGWQWGCSTELINQICVPIIVYSVGYNRFINQDDFDRDIFDKHIQLLIKKSIFFSVRNNGSRLALKNYVSKDEFEKISINFCPSILFPRSVIDRKIGTKKVGILLAGDRLELRHSDMRRFIKSFSGFVKEISKYSKIYFVGHQDNDFWYINELSEYPSTIIDLTNKKPKEVISFYNGLDIMIGDRGHSQMIPFGLGCKIVSIISHNKLKWFLKDINLCEYGIHENDDDLKEKVLSLIFLGKEDTYSERRIQALRSISKKNFFNMSLIYEKIMSALQIG